MMTIKDIPERDLKALTAAFYATENYKCMQREADSLFFKGRYIESMKLKKKIKDLLELCKQRYVEEYNNAKTTLSLSSAGLPKEDLEHVTTLIMTLFVCCDLIESCQQDIQKTLHNTDTALSFEMFLGLRDLAKEVKKKINYLLDDTSYMSTNYWGDVCDNMYEMMKNKARSIIRKVGNKPSK